MKYLTSLQELQGRYPPYQTSCLKWTLVNALATFSQTIVVLDDDPTGTQTVQGVPVITCWDRAVLQRELLQKPRMLFILTNSRALSKVKTAALHKELAENLQAAARAANQEFLLVSRGDSTLRGHFPLETETLRMTLEKNMTHGFDGEILCPFFPEGGRYTAEDIHYLLEGDALIPVGKSEFAKDKTFGYTSSHLGEWIAEKTNGAYPAEQVISISLAELRKEDRAGILEKLMQASDFQKIIVNAIAYEDLQVFVPILFHAIKEGKQFLLRTASAILKVMNGNFESTILTHEKLVDKENHNGGLIIVGSHVKKTTMQLSCLQRNGLAVSLELNQHLVLQPEKFSEEICRVSRETSRLIADGKTVVVSTRRERLDLNGADKEAELDLAGKISDGLVSVVSGLNIRPNFIIAKGGITSSDVATKGLNIHKAQVLGQILPGIPVWKTGEESKFPQMPYVVFPGNVGTETALLEAVEKLTPFVHTREGQ